MDRYSANGQIAAVTVAPGATALGIIASTLTRAQIMQIILMVGGTPVADNILQWLIRRFTTVGTSTAVVPTAEDFSAPASQLAAGQQFTAEPTYTVTVFAFYSHQRSAFTWNAHPGSEVKIPAVANNGIGFTPIHASYVGSAQASCVWQE